MKRVTILGGTLVALVAVGGVYLKPQVLPQPKPITTRNTSIVSQPAPQPAPVAPATTTQTTTTATTTTTSTPTTLFSDSSSNYAPGAVATTASISIDGPWTMDYNYTCDGSKGVIIAFHNNAAGGSFGAGNQGSSYTGSLPIAGPSYGTFRVVPPVGETCTWSISGTN